MLPSSRLPASATVPALPLLLPLQVLLRVPLRTSGVQQLTRHTEDEACGCGAGSMLDSLLSVVPELRTFAQLELQVGRLERWSFVVSKCI
jgi:hypothetical protein